ncbi:MULTISPECIES: ATP-binding protein [unclassified Martelella]|uniref:ATP-binding protein n=1 Tax=unclassified Martelella TaxID=2629616 RepID=UPI0025C16F44|nr:ATP-binding protein [Martelella sp.]
MSPVLSMKRYKISLGSIAVVFVSAVVVWLLVDDRMKKAILVRLEQSAFLAARSVEAEIDRFRYLPTIAGEDERVRALLRAPRDPERVASANAYLSNAVAASGATYLYLLDSEGLTLASSNWDQPDSLVGRNYGFRPYFKDAMKEGDGSYYGIGVTTGKPGYFMSRRIDAGPGGQPGVVVVKIDLLPLEASWESAAQNLSLADRYGIVFLTGNSDWKYRPIARLTQATLDTLIASRTYEGIDLSTRQPIAAGENAGDLLESGEDLFERIDDNLLSASIRLPREGWTLFASADLTPARDSATLWSLITVLVGMLLTGALHFLLQRRQLVALRLQQSEMLERKVEERTRDLAHEIEVRKAAEHDLKVAQDGLVHAEKMAALGRMSAAIVHEVSQPLAALETTLASTSLLARSVEEKGVSSRIDSARNLVRRMQKTVRHLKTFSRKDRAEIEVFDCVESLRAAVEIAGSRADRIGVKPKIEARGAAYVAGSAIRLEQVFLNLLLNAIDALEQSPSPRITVTVNASDAYVDIAVSDNGHGISPENFDQAMEPFFTTKAGSEGLGLGLSISAAIVEDHGGELCLSPDPQGGTRATVRLPLHVEKVRAAE